MAYSPKAPPRDPAQLPEFLQQELADIARGQVDPRPVLRFQVLRAAPAKYQAGDVVYADGVTWNPGSGEGLYRRTLAGAWAFIG